jgi:predicted RNA binding protein YcfA (HicA-like mRNA interferase family)
MYKNIALAFLILAPLLLVNVVIAIHAERRIRPYYATIMSLSKQFSGELSLFNKYFMHQPCFVGTFSGCKFSATYTTDKVLNVWNLRLDCHVLSPGKLKIFMYERNPFMALFMKKIRIGGHDFDQYEIYSNMPDAAMRYFADDKKKENIKQLLANGWQPPRITGKKIFTCSQVRPGPDLDPEMVRTTLQNLIALRIEHR